MAVEAKLSRGADPIDRRLEQADKPLEPLGAQLETYLVGDLAESRGRQFSFVGSHGVILSTSWQSTIARKTEEHRYGTAGSASTA
jgi:hypothetical protein